MPSNRGRQKSLEKKKKRREAARSSAAVSSRAPAGAALVRLAASGRPGPVFMSGEWQSDDEADPQLVSILFTRALGDGTFVGISCLVDRACFGVKDAFVRGPMTHGELDSMLSEYDDIHGAFGFSEVTLLEAQSVVYHAIDFAAQIGFAPHRDFPEALVGPRPEALLDTPLSRPVAPRFIPGPHDNIVATLAKLEAHDAKMAAIASGGE